MKHYVCYHCSGQSMLMYLAFILSQSCDFVKKRNDTVLRVVWNGGLRLIDKGSKVDSMRRWFFTINGEECKKPRTIDVQLYSFGKGLDFHKPAYGGWAHSFIIHILFASFITFRPLKLLSVSHYCYYYYYY